MSTSARILPTLYTFLCFHAVAGADYVMDIYRDATCTTTNDAQPSMTFTPVTGSSGCFQVNKDMMGEAYVKMTCNAKQYVDIMAGTACDASQTMFVDHPWSSALDFLQRRACTILPGSWYYGDGLYGKLREVVTTDSFPACGPMDAMMHQWVMSEYTDSSCSSPKTGGVNEYPLQLQSHRAGDHCFMILGTVSVKPVCEDAKVRVDWFTNPDCEEPKTFSLGIFDWDDALKFFGGGGCVRQNPHGTYGKLDKCVPEGNFPTCGDASSYSCATPQPPATLATPQPPATLSIPQPTESPQPTPASEFDASSTMIPSLHWSFIVLFVASTLVRMHQA